ncbi:MAG: signal peptidase I [Rickettsiales bacterium]|jgi:signal peptidase I|nr:signal peptidase I [Rickettsiales bacterium]
MAKKHTNSAKEWINTLFWAGLIAICFRSVLIEPFNIPSGSMIPTLQVGDHIFIKKWSYGYSRYSFPFGSWHLWNGRIFGDDPKMGDIIVFRNPANESLDYVKRLVGMPGDKIQMNGGRLYINGKQIVRKNPTRYIIAHLPTDIRRTGFYKNDISIRGNKLFVNDAPANFNYTIEYKSRRECEMSAICMSGGLDELTEWTEVLPNGTEHQIVERGDNEMYDNTKLFSVPDGHYFMMGDDRDWSADSRADVGFVPREYLMGRVWFIWYSHNYFSPMLYVWDWAKKFRWNRIGDGVH